MNTYPNIKADFLDLVSRNNALFKAVKPYRDSFHAFLLKNGTHPLFGEHYIKVDDETPDAEQYEMEVFQSLDGIVFYSNVIDSDDIRETLFFVVPFDYFNDPQKWESDILQTIDSLTAKAEQVYDSIAPNVREELGLKIVVRSVDKAENKVYAYPSYDGQHYLEFGHPERDVIKVAGFSFNPDTGEVLSKMGFDLRHYLSKNAF